MADPAKAPPVPKKRLLSRLGRQLVLHVHTVSLLCYTAGVVAVLLLPLLAKNTYISENALMPGSGNPIYGNADTLDARAAAAEVKILVSQGQDGHRAVSRWLIKRMGALGADCYLHPFLPSESASSTRFPTPSQHFKWSTSNLTNVGHMEKQKRSAVNVVGIIRAPQGEGNEAIVLVTPFDAEHFGEEDALSLGLGLALFARLSKALWIARDIIWLAADAKYGAYPAVAEWLKEYHEPSINHFPANSKLKSDLVKELLFEGQSSGEKTGDVTLSDFKRAGVIATGLVFELKITHSEAGNTVKLRAEGPNGQMPNLDLINIINSIAVWRESLSLRLEALPSLRAGAWLNHIGELLEKVSNLASGISPTWDFSIDAVAYPKSLATLLSSMFFQVVGLPTGAHGAFRDYQIDAVSLQFPIAAKVSDYNLTKYGRLLEGVLRCVNNLLEKWHQSFFLYFLSAPNKYISVGVYMQPFALLLISLPLTAAALCFPVYEEDSLTKDSKENSADTSEKMSEEASGNRGRDQLNPEGRSAVDDSGKWLQALLLVSSVHIWALFVALILSLISQTNLTPELKLLLWLAIVAASLKVSMGVHNFFATSMDTLRSCPRDGNTQLWVAVKALTLGVTSIGLAVMSTVNYPVALIGALVLVPICLGVFPLQYGWKFSRKPGSTILTLVPFAIGAFLTILGSPPGLVGLGSIFYGHFWRPTPANFWYLMESLLTWRSALFPYLLVIHLPCSVLCLYILFSTDLTN